MPAKRKARPRYVVFAFRYASIEDKEKHSRGEVPNYQVSIVHRGTSEALALRHFGHACIKQTADPLASYVELERNREVLARVKPLPRL
jgi:hypothetical protein